MCIFGMITELGEEGVWYLEDLESNVALDLTNCVRFVVGSGACWAVIITPHRKVMEKSLKTRLFWQKDVLLRMISLSVKHCYCHLSPQLRVVQLVVIRFVQRMLDKECWNRQHTNGARFTNINYGQCLVEWFSSNSSIIMIYWLNRRWKRWGNY